MLQLCRKNSFFTFSAQHCSFPYLTLGPYEAQYCYPPVSIRGVQAPARQRTVEGGALPPYYLKKTLVGSISPTLMLCCIRTKVRSEGVARLAMRSSRRVVISEDQFSFALLQSASMNSALLRTSKLHKVRKGDCITFLSKHRVGGIADNCVAAQQKKRGLRSIAMNWSGTERKAYVQSTQYTACNCNSTIVTAIEYNTVSLSIPCCASKILAFIFRLKPKRNVLALST